MRTIHSTQIIAKRARISAAGLVLPIAVAMLAACDLTKDDDSNERENKALRPELREATDARVSSLTRPEGFRVQVFARDLGHARMIAAAPDGWVYLTCPQQGQVKMLRDTDGDGDADSIKVALDGLEGVHGITLKDGSVYLASVNKVMRSQRSGDGTLSAPETLYDSLPSGGQHGNRTLAFGPDGFLYVSVGSTCNACRETDSLHADPIADGCGRERGASLRERLAQYHRLRMASRHQGDVGHGPRQRRSGGQPASGGIEPVAGRHELRLALCIRQASNRSA